MASFKQPGGACRRSANFCPWMMGPCVACRPRFPEVSELPARHHTDISELTILFNACLVPKADLTDNSYQDAARSLGVEVEAIKAVASVETKGATYDVEGRPTILYERHYFHNLTGGKYDATDPAISNKVGGGYGKFSAQYGKLAEAFALAPEAALMSASWGRFQIMGANYREAGFSTVQDFVSALISSEAAHLSAFVSFVKNNPSMLKALQEKDWAKFAKSYNGPKYKANNYDEKMKAEYERLKPKKSEPVE